MRKPRGRKAARRQDNFEAAISFLKELVDYLKSRKKLWLMPLVVLFVLFGALFVLGQGSVVAPFIYTLF